MRPRSWMLAAAFLSLALALAPAARAADEGSIPLVNGDDPKQFELVGIGPEALNIDRGEVRVSGRPNGYFATKQSYKNYKLTFDWMYDRPEGLADDAKFRGNSGLLLHIQPPQKVWPKSVEVQLMNADAGNILNVSGATCKIKKDPAAQSKAIKPVGQWNATEVVCRDGAIVCAMNGVEIARGTNANPDSGALGWQSEGAPIRFRNLRITPTDKPAGQ